MLYIKNLDGRTVTLDVEPSQTVLDIKRRIAASEGIEVENQRLLCNGHQLEDEDEVEEESTLYISLRLLGGGKKRKKKVYTTPKKNKHKKKKVKLAALRYYKVDANLKITRLRKECTSATCGGGVFMAAHENRFYCGKCHKTLVVEEPVEGSAAKAVKGKKK